MYRSEENLGDLVLPFYDVVSGAQVQVIRSGVKCLYQQNLSCQPWLLSLNSFCTVWLSGEKCVQHECKPKIDNKVKRI